MISEFGLIAHLKELCLSLPQNGFEGIGDDCAILPIGEGEALVFTADLVVEGIHFLREAMSPEEVAKKALQVNLSDVVAMGVAPVATILSLALPQEIVQSDWPLRFAKAYTSASKQRGVALIGGDTTSSKREICINVTAIGRGKVQQIKRRSDARIGDIICIGRPLGGSAAGLKEILVGRYDSPLAQLHKNPKAQIEEGIWLGSRDEVHAMMDISDGLASDLKHILTSSKVGAEVEIDRVPIAPGATSEEALTGGEEYTLLLSVQADKVEELGQNYLEQFGLPLYEIGRITAGPVGEIQWYKTGEAITGSWQGFRHF